MDVRWMWDGCGMEKVCLRDSDVGDRSFKFCLDSGIHHKARASPKLAKFRSIVTKIIFGLLNNRKSNKKLYSYYKFVITQ